MRKSRGLLLCLVVVAGLGLGLAGCSSRQPEGHAPAQLPDGLVIDITNEGEIQTPVQPFFTDEPAMRLLLTVQSHGGNLVTAGNMLGKTVTLVSVTRTDRTSSMFLGSVVLAHVEGQEHLYRGQMVVLLPKGTYALSIDGKVSGVVIEVLAKTPSSPCPSPTA